MSSCADAEQRSPEMNEAPRRLICLVRCRACSQIMAELSRCDYLIKCPRRRCGKWNTPGGAFETRGEALQDKGLTTGGKISNGEPTM